MFHENLQLPIQSSLQTEMLSNEWRLKELSKRKTGRDCLNYALVGATLCVRNVYLVVPRDMWEQLLPTQFCHSWRQVFGKNSVHKSLPFDSLLLSLKQHGICHLPN